MLFLFDNYALDTDRRELRRGAVAVPVEPKVFDLLAYLIENRERVASKDDLIAAVWGGRVVSESALTSRINAARCAIGDTGGAASDQDIYPQGPPLRRRRARRGQDGDGDRGGPQRGGDATTED